MGFGSLVNHVMAHQQVVIPKIGDPATILGWSDRYAATVVWVTSTGSKVIVQRDKATLKAGSIMSECQEYEYERNPESSREVFTRRRDGQYRQRGGGNGLTIGRREEYRDPSF